MAKLMKWGARLSLKERDEFILAFTETEIGGRAVIAFQTLKQDEFINVVVEPKAQDTDSIEAIFEILGWDGKFKKVSSWWDSL